MNLQTYYDSLMQRIKADKNKEKYAAISLNSTSSKEFTYIKFYIEKITSTLEKIPTLSDKKEKDFQKNSCMNYLKKLERLLDEHGW